MIRFLDKAAIVTPSDELKPNGEAANRWRLCTLQQVEEVKCVARIIPVWSTAIVFYTAIAQQSTYIVYQALQSDRRLIGKFEIPAASFVVFSMLALTIWIPIYDRILVPYLRRLTGKDEGLTLLQRMGIGMVLGVVAMVVAALVEERRRSYAVHRPLLGVTSSGGGVSSMSSLWLVFQLTILGLAEAFAVISQVEFNYKQFPEHMRSVAGALLFLGFALSNYLSSLMVTIVHLTTGADGGEDHNWLAQDLNKGRLDYFYLMIAILGVFNLFYFLVCAKWYRYKGSHMSAGEIALEGKDSKVSLV